MKIEIGEHCFGSYATVNGTSLTESEEGLFDPVAQKDIRGAILLEVMQNMDNIPSYYWKELAEMAVSGNPRYERDDEETFLGRTI